MDFNRSCLKEVDFNGIKFGRKCYFNDDRLCRKLISFIFPEVGSLIRIWKWIRCNVKFVSCGGHE